MCNHTKHQGLIARSSGIRGADCHGCVARRARRAADQATGRIQRQPGWQCASDREGGRAVAGRDLMAEYTADCAVSRGRTADHRGLGEDAKAQGLITRTSAIRRADGDRCIARRARRAADQATGRIQRQPGWQCASDREGGRAVAGRDLMAEYTADCAVSRGRTANVRRQRKNLNC